MYLPGDRFSIAGRTYVVAALPGVPAFSDAREGRAATVYRVQYGRTNFALKVFKTGFAREEPARIRDVMTRLSIVPGLMVASHTAVERSKHGQLLLDRPDLEHAHLMPWVEGPTWQSFIVDRRPINGEDAIAVAKSLASTLAQLESMGMAHCDLSGGNVLLPIFADGSTYKWPAELVDLDQLFCAELGAPVQSTLGSPGYQLSASARAWGPNADRYSGGVLLAEILAWPDAAVRSASGAESYYDPTSRQESDRRTQIQVSALEHLYGPGSVATLLSMLKGSDTLDRCPSLAEWHAAVSMLDSETANSPIPIETAGPASRLVAQPDASRELPTWEYDLGSSRQRRLAEGLLLFCLVAAAGATAVAAGFAEINSLTNSLREAGGQAFAQAPGGVAAGLMVGGAEAWLLRRTFGGYAASAFVASSMAGGGLGAFVGGLSFDQLQFGWFLAGACAGAIAGAIAGAVQATRLVRGSQWIWIAYHVVGWAAIWGIAWSARLIAPAGMASTVLASVILVLASGLLTALAIQSLPELEF